MEHIQGQPIDDYCKQHKLGVRARLELFRTLCEAVQYVHQHLMVHGDLKCSNVLVSANGTVKLLDFGIARLLSPTPAPAANPADQKLTGFVAMTPEYASPEQIRGGAITTVSDVYSLGVVLYQLLTGVLPYKLRGDFSYELVAQIVDREAAAPSVAAKTVETDECTGFGRALRGDLDNIVLMALGRIRRTAIPPSRNSRTTCGAISKAFRSSRVRQATSISSASSRDATRPASRQWRSSRSH